MADKKNLEKLKDIRKKIDQLDLAILKSLSNRVNLVIQAGEIKKKNNDNSFYKPERESQIIRSLISKNKSVISKESLETIYKEIISACFVKEKEIDVYFLGPRGTYSELACKKNFGSSVNSLACKSILDIFKTINDENSFGVVPLENSTEGAVNLTLDALQTTELKICGELEMPIKHSLLASQVNLEKIKNVYGHQQSLAQCKNKLSNLLPRIKITPVESSGLALKKAQQGTGNACIAHESFASEHNLKVCKKNMEDEKNNTTRFIILGKNMPLKSGLDKTSIIISLENKPGALSRVLKIFELSKVNLSYIQSRPSKKDKWSYSFFLDFEGHSESIKIKNLLKKLENNSISLKLLGSYPKAI
ncbi:MAG: prephenate dehydratase [Gammaproteobacteria bacterium]|tara:strand:- start:932 stop:2017 length:1086 start_codon:yes stop_codon:yes gene_type:complete